jgi:hypothetical protein
LPIALLLIVAVGFVVWKLHAAGRRFLPEFAQLLTGAQVTQGPLTVLSGRSHATGQFRERDVAIRLQLRRGRYQLGYLVVAMRTSGPQTLDSSGVDSHTRDDAGRKALFTTAANDLLLSVEDGWLKTMWKPVGFAVFPGTFSEEHWRPVLEAMHAVAASLES